MPDYSFIYMNNQPIPPQLQSKVNTVVGAEDGPMKHGITFALRSHNF
jgi:hypothetical protein